MSSPRIKVLFVITDLSGGGAERVVLTLMRSLDRERFQPSLFLLRNEGVYWDEVPKDTKINYGVLGGGTLKRRALGILRKLCLEVAQNDVIIGALELLPSYLTCISAALRRKPAIAWVHTDLEKHLPIFGAARMHRIAVKAIYPRFRKIVFPSRSACESFLRILPTAAPRTQVIANPLDSTVVLTKGSGPSPDWAEAVFIKPTVVAVGLLSIEHKGFDVLIRAHAQLVSRGLDHNLLILGEGQDRRLLEDLAQEVGASKSIFLPGFQQNPYPLIKRACALAVTSRFEAFGMVILEAMALGVPVICLDTAAGAQEILDRGAYGMCVVGNDPVALASGINAVITDPALHHRYKCLGKERVKCFQAEHIVSQWEELIWSLAPSNSL